MFKIVWKSKITGHRGEGKPIFKTKEAAERKIKATTAPGITHHVEEVAMDSDSCAEHLRIQREKVQNEHDR